MHDFIFLHFVPQPPQFRASVAVSTHALEHREKPALQAVPQALPEQVAVPLGVPGHTVPHAPQLLGSLLVSAQASAQRMKGRLHWNVQPLAHTGMAFFGALHTTPHRPQFEVSLAMSTHEPLQFV